MSLAIIFSVLFVVFYFGIGIGTALKFHGALTCEVAAKIIFLHPAQVILVSIMLLVAVTSECFEKISKETRCGTVCRLILRVCAPWNCLTTCIEIMPMVAGRLAYLTIKSKSIKHVMKKTKNDFARKITDQLSLSSYGFC